MTIEDLRPEDVDRIRLPWTSSFEPVGLATLLEHDQVPGLWIPSTGEYLIGGRWRGRQDIASIAELHARANAGPIVALYVDRARELGALAVVVSASEVWRDVHWYRKMGFTDLDQIVTMVLDLGKHPSPKNRSPRLGVRAYQPSLASELGRVDRESFDWLWWNDPSEFERYRTRADVEVWAGYLDHDLVSYASVTLRPGKAHLDRLAVRRSHQRHGLGREMLSFVLQREAENGVRQVALTTQVTNSVAQTLYSSFGFRRTNEIEPIVGIWTTGHRPGVTEG